VCVVLCFDTIRYITLEALDTFIRSNPWVILLVASQHHSRIRLYSLGFRNHHQYHEFDRGNLILADCLEDRWIDSRDYVRPCPTTTTGHPTTTCPENERRVVTRTLQQAMVPGPELVRVQQVLGLGLVLGGRQSQRGLSSPATEPPANHHHHPVVLG
jgi:hypothetical protein